MNDLLIKALITVMVIDAGMHFYYDHKKNTYQSLKFLALTVLMAVSVEAALTKQEIDNVWEKMTIIEQKIEMQGEKQEKGVEKDESIHEIRMPDTTDNRCNKVHKERVEGRENRQFKMVNICTDDGRRIVIRLYK